MHVYGSVQCSLSIGKAIQRQKKPLSVTQNNDFDGLVKVLKT